MNVTLTRARRGLMVLWNAATFLADKECWGVWLRWAMGSGLVYGDRRAGEKDPALLQALDELKVLQEAALSVDAVKAKAFLAAQEKKQMGDHSDKLTPQYRALIAKREREEAR